MQLCLSHQVRHGAANVSKPILVPSLIFSDQAALSDIKRSFNCLCGYFLSKIKNKALLEIILLLIIKICESFFYELKAYLVNAKMGENFVMTIIHQLK